MNATEAVAVLRAAIEKHRAPEWECNSDHPALLAALDATAAIAPPVAAGSVDTEEFAKLLHKVIDYAQNWAMYPEKRAKNRADFVAHIDAWGAQQRELGKQEVSQLILLQQPLTDAAAAWDRIKRAEERAEKAEAEVAESRKWHAKLERTVIEYDDNLKAAEARVKELEEDAMRWRHLRDLDHNLTGTPGQPCVALPNGMDSGYYLTGPEAVFAVDASMAEHSDAIDPSDTPC